jgi:hypothetical protein
MNMFGSGMMQGVGGGLQNAQRGNMLKQMMTAQGGMQPPMEPPMPEQLAGPPPDPSMMPQQQPDMGGMLKQALMRLFMPQ